MYRRFIVLVAATAMLAASGSVLAQSVPSSGSKQALVRVVNHWDSSCDASTRWDWDNMADAWYDEIRDTRSTPKGHGSRAWTGDGFYKNGSIVDSDFTDSDRVSWGKDHWNDRADDVDACFLALHGSHWGSGDENYLGSVRVDESGDGNCSTNQDHMRLGDGDLEFFHLSSCHSMCLQNWDEWFDTFSGLHQIDGWYGIMWISTVYNNNYEDFADDAFNSVGMAYAWIDNHYSTGFWTLGHDHCPVAMAVGFSAGSVTTRIANEQYDSVYSDPVGAQHRLFYAIEGCDPKDHGALNP